MRANQLPLANFWIWSFKILIKKNIKNISLKRSTLTFGLSYLVLDLEKKISEILRFLTFNFLQHKFQEFGGGGRKA